jgi:myo-inositol 2-dehydrogenase / D-chiro-inositol 1-dehydrogenase
VRVGVVGPGYIGARHIEAWRHLGVALHGYTRSPARRAEVAAAYPEVTWHPSLDSLLAAVEVVDVCTPTDTHAELALRAAAAGRHVVCEKPLARTLDEADKMISACEQARVQLHVAHVARYYAGYAAARQAVQDGEVGEPTALKLYRGGAAPGWSAWFADLDRSGGVLVDLGIHDIDFARWVAGEVVEATGTMTGPGCGRAVLAHAGGARSQVTAEWGAAGEPFHTWFEISGTAGELHHDSRVEAGRDADPMVEMLGEFRAAIRGGPQPRITVDDARAALGLALAAAEAAG